MTTVRILITLRSGVLDAPGQAIRHGLRALGYSVEEVRAGKYLEIELPDSVEHDGRTVESLVEEMCSRFLANPLIESWRIVSMEAGDEQSPGESMEAGDEQSPGESMKAGDEQSPGDSVQTVGSR